MEILSPAFCHRICPSYFDTCHKPAIPAFEGHASQASEPPRTTSILPAYALPTSDRPMLVVPFPRVLFKFRRLGVRMWSRPQGKAARVGHPGSACPSMRVFDVVLSQSWSGVMRMSGSGAAPLAADKGNSARASQYRPCTCYYHASAANFVGALPVLPSPRLGFGSFTNAAAPIGERIWRPHTSWSAESFPDFWRLSP
jgi:hypothetical protein